MVFSHVSFVQLRNSYPFPLQVKDVDLCIVFSDKIGPAAHLHLSHVDCLLLRLACLIWCWKTSNVNYYAVSAIFSFGITNRHRTHCILLLRFSFHLQQCHHILSYRLNENLWVWKPESYHLTDRSTPMYYRSPAWKGLKLLLIILKAFPWFQRMDVKCVGRSTLFKNISAALRLSDTSGLWAVVIHQDRSLGSLLWACCLTRGSMSLEAELIGSRLCGHGWGWL